MHRRHALGVPAAGLVLLGVAMAGAALSGCAGGARISSASAASDTVSTTTPTTSTPTTPKKPKAAPLPVTRITGLPGVTVKDGTAPLRVRLSGVVALNSPHPTLIPSVAGHWTTDGDTVTFTPESTLPPCTAYQLFVSARTVAKGRRPLGASRTLKLSVPCPSTKAVQQALTRLGFLPYSLHSAHGSATLSGPESRAAAAKMAFHPTDRLTHRLPYAPPVEVGTLDAVTRGAIMYFQSLHGLAADGSAGATTWAALLAAETAGKRNPVHYTWVDVSKGAPETLTLHRGHSVLLSTPVNTGVAGADTEDGTFPIFSRFTSTTMVGTNPDGTKYNDPGVPWVNYFNGGDAVHGFPRASYGSPQSNGCVELPIDTAKRVYAQLAIGEIVVVSG